LPKSPPKNHSSKANKGKLALVFICLANLSLLPYIIEQGKMQHWQSSPHQQGLETGGLGNERDLAAIRFLVAVEMLEVVLEPGKDTAEDVPVDDGMVQTLGTE